MVSLPVVLAVAGLLFGIGLYGALGQTNAIIGTPIRAVHAGPRCDA